MPPITNAPSACTAQVQATFNKELSALLGNPNSDLSSLVKIKSNRDQGMAACGVHEVLKEPIRASQFGL